MPVEMVKIKAILPPPGMLVPAFGNMSEGRDQLRSPGPETVSCRVLALEASLQPSLNLCSKGKLHAP